MVARTLEPKQRDIQLMGYPGERVIMAEVLSLERPAHSFPAEAQEDPAIVEDVDFVVVGDEAIRERRRVHAAGEHQQRHPDGATGGPLHAA
jgi:hypothetical protein